MNELMKLFFIFSFILGISFVLLLNSEIRCKLYHPSSLQWLKVTPMLVNDEASFQKIHSVRAHVANIARYIFANLATSEKYDLITFHHFKSLDGITGLFDTLNTLYAFSSYATISSGI